VKERRGVEEGGRRSVGNVINYNLYLLNVIRRMNDLEI
jgi:hypothetical protein